MELVSEKVSRWSQAEKDILLEEASKTENLTLIQARVGKKVTGASKDMLWMAITEWVNALGGGRTVEQVKKQYANTTNRASKAVQRQRQEMRLTGMYKIFS